MSTVSTPELDFWEFVNCARCHLPFNTDGGSPPVPFWLTECGHVICNNHLSESGVRFSVASRLSADPTNSRNSVTDTDQSCAQCGAQGIQLIPLQKEVGIATNSYALLAPDTHILYSSSHPCPNGSVLCHKVWTLWPTQRGYVSGAVRPRLA